MSALGSPRFPAIAWPNQPSYNRWRKLSPPYFHCPKSLIHCARLGLQHLEDDQLAGHRFDLHVQERQLVAEAHKPGIPEGKHDAKGPGCLRASSAKLRRASSTPTSSALLPPYPPSLREHQEAHARYRSRTRYSATIAVTL